jgi:hypothetical protein
MRAIPSPIAVTVPILFTVTTLASIARQVIPEPATGTGVMLLRMLNCIVSPTA